MIPKQLSPQNTIALATAGMEGGWGGDLERDGDGMLSKRVIKDMRRRQRVVWCTGTVMRRVIFIMGEQMGNCVFSLFVVIAARCVLSLC